MIRPLRNCWSPLLGGWLLVGSIAGAGCNHVAAPEPPKAPPPPEVVVALPTYEEITDHEDFTGQTEAVKSIEIRARVTGYLKTVDFQDGAEVEAGAPLFQIDPPYYEAERDRAEGNVGQAEAHLARLELDFERAEKLHPTGVITKEQYDLVTGDLAEAEATLKAAKAALKIARVNLGYCDIKAPIAGRLSRPFIDPGNLVIQDDTILTRIVAQNPMDVYFDIDERTMLRLRRLSQKGISASPQDESLPLLMGLADEEGYPHQGILNFEDNRLDPSTGTLRVRGVFPNPDRLLTPGLFVRVRVPIGVPYRALLVPEPALGADQGQKFLYVVDDKNEVSYRRVRVGRLHGQLRVVTEGVSPGERVVVSGLQRVRPGAKVAPKLIETPKVASLPSREEPFGGRSTASSNSQREN
ncbi:MAG TPA: efflux RND transporter periplasmic adaptor subunit [Pirellulales bacterium]|nr:efflux RND transporter periplasmic adaptor subunit [Pirellulales bacterium]